MEDNVDINLKLKNLLKNLGDWEKTPTNIPGVKIIKIPAKKDVPARLGIEINPVDSSGRLIKKTGAVVLTNFELFDMYFSLFSRPKIRELMHEIDSLRKEIYPQISEKHQDVIFEI
jgi:hypothetical protein